MEILREIGKIELSKDCNRDRVLQALINQGFRIRIISSDEEKTTYGILD